MKQMIAAAVALLAGLAVGGYAGYHLYERYVTNQAVKLMLESGESFEAERAARATRAIQLIESGETQKAVQLLATPIADYYEQYADRPNTEQRRKTCAMIEQLIRTNQMVAEQITNRMSSAQSHQGR